VEFRVEQAENAAAVRELHLAAFGDHGQAVADLVDGLRGAVGADDGLSLVAEDAGRIVGHVMFTRSLLDATRRLVDVHVLSPVAVLPDRQGQGIGSMLIQRGLGIMTEWSVPLVFLEGSPDYYSRLGFLAGAGLGFRRPSLRIPVAAFQVIRLPAYEPWMTGSLIYADVFWQHDAVGLRDPDA
jgi:putative acetyltransferase